MTCEALKKKRSCGIKKCHGKRDGNDDQNTMLRSRKKAKYCRVLHTIFLLLRKRRVGEMMYRCKARVVVCDNEKQNFEKDIFSPVADFKSMNRYIHYCTEKMEKEILDLKMLFLLGT